MNRQQDEKGSRSHLINAGSHFWAYFNEPGTCGNERFSACKTTGFKRTGIYGSASSISVFGRGSMVDIRIAPNDCARYASIIYTTDFSSCPQTTFLGVTH